VEISAKTDYAIRASLVLASRAPELVKVDQVAAEQELPRKFVEAILGELRRAGIVRSRRGAEGGYTLARAPGEVSLGEIMRAVDGPLAEVRGQRPDQVVYGGVARYLPQVWVAMRASLRHVLDGITLAHIVSGDLPAHVRVLLEQPGAWQSA